MKSSVIVLCAGWSNRFGSDKMRLNLHGYAVREAAVHTFAKMPEIDQIIIAAPQDKLDEYKQVFAAYTVVEGGATRQESMRNALSLVDREYVLVHDGARANVDEETIRRVLVALREHDAVVPTIPITDSLIAGDRYIDRAAYRAVQTPQGFRTDTLRRCLACASGTYTDEGSMVAKTHAVFFVEGDVSNRKLTYPVDYYGMGGEWLTGVGYDIHVSAPDRKLVLCGMHIPFETGLMGHSDADCCLHAIMDACLTAVGLPDIGHYFPNTPEWKDADSAHLLSIVKEQLQARGAYVTSVALSIVCEAPKLAPYIPKMKENLAKLLEIDPKNVGIAATTNEGVPMRIQELVTTNAIAAFASVMVRKKV